jgi:hypothetical protein
VISVLAEFNPEQAINECEVRCAGKNTKIETRLRLLSMLEMCGTRSAIQFLFLELCLVIEEALGQTRLDLIRPERSWTSAREGTRVPSPDACGHGGHAVAGVVSTRR